MRLIDYKMSSDNERSAWLDDFTAEIGLRYFGGKSTIARYILNRAFNMASRMYDNGDKADIFVDAFTGGGKIGLSIPDGWFDTIVMNDLDYGVYSFYKCCKDQPEALIDLITTMGKVFNEDMYHLFLLNRTVNNKTKTEERVDKLEKEIGELKEKLKEKRDNLEANTNKTEEIEFDIRAIKTTISSKKKQLKLYNTALKNNWLTDKPLNNLTAGAITYWVTSTTWTGETDPVAAWEYTLSKNDNKLGNTTQQEEKLAITKTVDRASKRIMHLHEIMVHKNIVIENLDYKELIKKYNGLSYTDANGTTKEADESLESLGKKNKLWYFDPPYHPCTMSLAYGGEALYELSFDYKLVNGMTDVLSGKDKTCGTLEYFIKSDYDPMASMKEKEDIIESCNARIEKLMDMQKKGTNKIKNAEHDDSVDKLISKAKANIYNANKQLTEINEHLDDFAPLEKHLSPCEDLRVINDNRRYTPLKEVADKDYIFYQEDLGMFRKSTIHGGDDTAKGHEFIWCKEKWPKPKKGI